MDKSKSLVLRAAIDSIPVSVAGKPTQEIIASLNLLYSLLEETNPCETLVDSWWDTLLAPLGFQYSPDFQTRRDLMVTVLTTIILPELESQYDCVTELLLRILDIIPNVDTNPIIEPINYGCDDSILKGVLSRYLTYQANIMIDDVQIPCVWSEIPDELITVTYLLAGTVAVISIGIAVIASGGLLLGAVSLATVTATFSIVGSLATISGITSVIGGGMSIYNGVAEITAGNYRGAATDLSIGLINTGGGLAGLQDFGPGLSLSPTSLERIRRVAYDLFFTILTGAPTASVFYSSTQATAQDYYNQGIQDIWDGEFNLAVESFTNAINIDPGFTGAYFFRGQVLMILARYDEAISDARHVIDADRGAPGGYELLADIYCNGLHAPTNTADVLTEYRDYLNAHGGDLLTIQSLTSRINDLDTNGCP